MSEKNKEEKGVSGTIKRLFGSNKGKCCCGMKIEEVKEEETKEKTESTEKK